MDVFFSEPDSPLPANVRSGRPSGAARVLTYPIGWLTQLAMMSRDPITPDGRYFVVRSRLWRSFNPALDSGTRTRLTHELMDARRAKGAAIRAGNPAAREVARLRVDAAKVALGERGPPWWANGAPDVNRRMVRNTGYAGWWIDVGQDTAEAVPDAEIERP